MSDTEALDMSYRYAWGLIKEVEDNLDVALLKTYKGGVHGGGGSGLTDEAQELVKKYEIAEKTFLAVACQLNSKFQQ
jgi:molybdate transport repressor ModE-like protein